MSAAKPRWGRPMAAAGWPVLAGLAAFVLGLLMLGGAAYFHRQARQLVASTAAATPDRGPAAHVEAAPSTPEGFTAQLPRYSTHLDDVGLLFRLAKTQGINIGPVTYRSETGKPMPVVVRFAEMQLDEEYPKLKAFIAESLRQLPHLCLEEIRVDQGSASSPKVQATLKLSFVYQQEAAPR